MFYYGQRSKCADLLNSYHLFLFLVERFKFPAASFIEPAEQLVVLETEYLDPDDQALHAAHERFPRTMTGMDGAPVSAPASIKTTCIMAAWLTANAPTRTKESVLEK